MRLGSSIRRRRFNGGKGSDSKDGGGFPGLPRIQWRLVSLVTVVIGFGIGTGFLFATRVLFPAPAPPGDLRQVPDLQGMEPEEAGQLASDVGLALGRMDSIRHPTVMAGEILGQSPLPGQLALAGDSVDITVSIGPEIRPVPDVLRLRGERARMVLEATGFAVVVDSIESEEPTGSVVGVEPEPETETALPAEVILTVSLGPPMVQMPDLMGLSEEEARATLDSLGLVVSDVESRFRFGMDQGRVVDQEPPAATMVERGSAVRVVVGRRGRGGRNNHPREP